MKKIFLKNSRSNEKVCIAKKHGAILWAESELECVLNKFFDTHQGSEEYELEIQTERDPKMIDQNKDILKKLAKY